MSGDSKLLSKQLEEPVFVPEEKRVRPALPSNTWFDIASLKQLRDFARRHWIFTGNKTKEELIELLKWYRYGNFDPSDLTECDWWRRSPSSFREEERRRLEKECAMERELKPQFVGSFESNKLQLTKYFLTLFDTEVFDNKLVGRLRVNFNPGLALAVGATLTHKPKPKTVAYISLASIYVNNVDVLRDTLIHELCHAACHIIDGESDKEAGRHGPLFFGWARKAETVFPSLPKITRYIVGVEPELPFKCPNCKLQYGKRHEGTSCYKCTGWFKAHEIVRNENFPSNPLDVEPEVDSEQYLYFNQMF